jgi:tetratricopeptide (TPR) repeat protein
MTEPMEKPRYLRLEEQNRHHWAFNRPVEWDFLDRKLEHAESIEREGDMEKAIKACLEIISSCPEYLPAINKLGLLYKQVGRLDLASEMFESAVGIGVACLPEKFDIGTDLIPWYWEDNRAFLLACEHLGVCHLENTLEVFEYSLKINPGYHGIDALVSKLREICTSIGIQND